MKKLLLCLVLMGWVLFQSSNAVADYVYGIGAKDIITFTKSTGPNDGGEFTWVAANGYTWQSFCIEKNENISLNHSYEVQGISGYAMAGGIKGQDAKIDGIRADSLNNESAWLFWNFSMGTLGTGAYQYDSNFSINNKYVHQGYLQNIIWYLEGEIDSLNDKTKKYYEAWNADYLDALNSGWKNQGQVQVVNLGSGKQDQLIIGTPVPEPGTMVLLGFGLIGIAGIGRKKPKK